MDGSFETAGVAHLPEVEPVETGFDRPGLRNT
jgi:hypothetical protein